MLVELYGKNFGCFRDEFRLSMLATDLDPDSDRGIVEAHVDGDEEPLRLLRAVAVYGANGSGKSTVLRSASALSHFIAASRSFTSDEPLRPYEPFALDSQSNKPVTLGVKAVVDSIVYDYFVEFDRIGFLREGLTKLSGPGPHVLLDRTHQAASGAWAADPQFQLLTKSFRRNALLLSLADSLAPELAKGIAVGLQRMLTSRDATAVSHFLTQRASHVAKRARDDEQFGSWLRTRLRSADIGVESLRTEPIRESIRPRTSDEDVETDAEAREQAPTSFRLSLLHGSSQGPVPLPYARESLGTRRLVELSPLLYDLAHSSKPLAAFVDEFDASMHPLLLKDVVQHLNCEIPVEHARGQLIFATHETTLLDDEAKDAVLRRDQVYFTEKDAAGASRLYSVAEFRERNNLNMRRRYLHGRYGALPSIGPMQEH